MSEELNDYIGIRVIEWEYDNMQDLARMTVVTMKEFLQSIDYYWWDFCERIANKKLYDEDYERIKKLPNFNKKIFEEITGIKVR